MNGEHNLLPTFIGIGPEKSGSTSLFKYLGYHPEIYLSPLKNLKYFLIDWDKHPRLKTMGYSFDDYRRGLPYRSRMVTSLNEYLKFFENSLDYKVRGEITPGYICQFNSAELIHSFNPNMKLIAVLRNPIERAWSQFNFNIQNGREKSNNILEIVKDEPFDTPIVFNSEFRSKTIPTTYIRQGLYYQNLFRYFNIFPEKNIKVVLYEDFKNSVKEVLVDIYKFLDVDPKYSIKDLEDFNVTRLPRNKMGKFLLMSNVPSRLATYTPKELHSKGKLLYNYILNKFTRRPAPLSNEMYEKLYQYFERDVLQLEQLIGKNLNHWKLPSATLFPS